MNFSKPLKCVCILALLMVEAHQLEATSLPDITLPDVFNEATEVLLAERDVNKTSSSNSPIHRQMFTVSRVWKSQTGIRPGDKIEVCNTQPNTDEFFEFVPKQNEKYVFFSRKKGRCLSLFFGILSFVALDRQSNRVAHTQKLINEPASQTYEQFFGKLTGLAAGSTRK